jgi:hypothetical protein
MAIRLTQVELDANREAEELFWISPDQKMMAATVTLNGETFVQERPWRCSRRRFTGARNDAGQSSRALVWLATCLPESARGVTRARQA